MAGILFLSVYGWQAAAGWPAAGGIRADSTARDAAPVGRRWRVMLQGGRLQLAQSACMAGHHGADRLAYQCARGGRALGLRGRRGPRRACWFTLLAWAAGLAGAAVPPPADLAGLRCQRRADDDGLAGGLTMLAAPLSCTAAAGRRSPQPSRLASDSSASSSIHSTTERQTRPTTAQMAEPGRRAGRGAFGAPAVVRRRRSIASKVDTEPVRRDDRRRRPPAHAAGPAAPPGCRRCRASRAPASRRQPSTASSKLPPPRSRRGHARRHMVDQAEQLRRARAPVR